MKVVCVLAFLSCAAANMAPTPVEVPEMGFKLNVLKNSESMTGCPESKDESYTVVSLLRTSKERTRILNPYVVKLLMQCKVREVHTWDLYEKEDGHLAGEMEDFDEKVPEMLKLYSDWRQRYVKSRFAEFYTKYDVPDYKKAVLLKLDDSVLYMDIGKLGHATTYALDHPENLLAIPNMVSGSTANLHQKCLPGIKLDMSNDFKSAVTHRLFMKDPSCFSLKDLDQSTQCIEINQADDMSDAPTGAYFVKWTNLQDLSALLKMGVGDEKKMFQFLYTRPACMLSTSTMASIGSSNKQSESLFLPVYKDLSKKIQAGARITDDGMAEEILKANGIDQGLPKKHMDLMAIVDSSVEQPTCPRIRSYVDLAQCGAPEKTSQKWLQLSETTPLECRRPCTAAPVEFQGAQFVSEEKRLALFASPKLTKPLTELFQRKAMGIAASKPETSHEAKDMRIVVSAHDPLEGFAQTFTNYMKAMKQIGVDKTSLKQTIAHCKAAPAEEGCKALLTQKLPVLEKWIELDSFDHSADNVTFALIQSVFRDINHKVYPGCEAQLGAGTAPQLAAFLPAYLTIQTKKPFHVLREEYAESDLKDLWEKMGMKVEEAKEASSLTEFGYSTGAGKASESAGAEDLKKDLKEAISLLEKKDGAEADSTIKAMEEIAKDVDARVQFDSHAERVKKLIKDVPELTKSFCSIYSMDYACLGYQEEFEKMCGAVEGPEEVAMRKDFILKVSKPKLALRQKQAANMRTMDQKSCLTPADSQISFLSFVNTVENCQAQCTAKAGCETYNYDMSTFACRLYNSAPIGAVQDLHATCGAICKDNDDGLARLTEERGLQSIGATCPASVEYCSNEDVALNCAASCGICTAMEL